MAFKRSRLNPNVVSASLLLAQAESEGGVAAVEQRLERCNLAQKSEMLKTCQYPSGPPPMLGDITGMFPTVGWIVLARSKWGEDAAHTHLGFCLHKGRA